MDYFRVLEDIMLPIVRAMAIPDPQVSQPIMFVQDRSPIHSALIVSEWFEEHSDIILINWPSKGCDRNPIENLWGTMKEQMEFGPVRDCSAIDQTVMNVSESIRWRPTFANVWWNLCQIASTRWLTDTVVGRTTELSLITAFIMWKMHDVNTV